MALFKILSNMNDSTQELPSSYHQGYCYFDVNTGKFWIDTSNVAAGRMAINAAHSDTADTSTYADYAISDGAGNSIVETYGASISYNTSTNAIYLKDVNGNTISSVTNLPAVINNLTSSSTAAEKNALSAKQGYLLANGSARDNTKLPLAGGTMSGNIVPDTANSRSLGTQSNYFKDIYGNTYYGGLQNSITIGSKSFDNTDSVVIEIADLGLAGTNMEFKGIVTDNLTDYPSQDPVHLKDGGTLTPLVNGYVVIDNTGREFIWSNTSWQNLGLATDFALANHIHGNINYNGTINTSTAAPSYSVTTKDDGVIIASDLSTTDVAVLNDATATSFVTSVTQNGAGKIFVEKADLVPYVKIAGDTMTGSLTISNTAGNSLITSGNIVIGTTADAVTRSLSIYTDKGLIQLSSNNNSDNGWTGRLAVKSTTASDSRTIIKTVNDANNTTTYYADIFESRSPGGENTTGFQVKIDTTMYGSLSISTAGTTETTGITTLKIGNSTGTGNNGNAQGKILLYGNSTSGHAIKSLSNATANYSVYIQNYGDNQYLVHTGSTSAVGSSNYRNVYVAENGRITEQTYDNVICDKEDAEPTLTYNMTSSITEPINIWQTTVNQNDVVARYGSVLSTKYFGLYNSTTSAWVTRLDLNGINQLSSNLTIQKTTANDTAFTVDNTNKSHKVSLEIGGSSGNGGIYDNTNSKWVVYSTTSGSVILNGNANTATILQTTRKINGTDFNGSADITTAKWGTARNLTIGSTAKSVDGSTAVAWTHAEIGATVSNTWANGTTSGPTIKTTVNGVAGTAVAIPSATGSISGVVTTTTQTFAGAKTFIGNICLKNSARWPAIYMQTTNSSNNVAGIIWSGANSSNDISASHLIFRHYSYSTTASPTSLTYYEDYALPDSAKDRTTNVTYQILTTKDYTAPDARYVKKSGDTMTGNLKVVAAGDHYVEAQNTNTSCRILLDSGPTTTKKHGLWSSGYYNTSYTASSCWILYRSSDSYVHTDTRLYGAVWNDYAEYRKDNVEESQLQKPGRCIRELGDGSLALTTKRLERGCEIISDTFGFAIGQDEENGYNTPIASNGRVLAYPYESIEEFSSHIGWPVCSGPDGTVSIMTEEEEEKYSSRIIGTISEIPDYEEWGTGKVKVNGRVWIRIK